MTRITVILGAACTAVALLALAGCDGPPEPTETVDAGPTVVVTPDLTGPVTSDSPLESDPWMSAVRAADLGVVLAQNHADFTIEQFTSTRVSGLAFTTYRRWTDRVADSGKPHEPILGPYPMRPISVAPTPDGSGATVVVCEVSSALDAPDPLTAPLTNGGIRTYLLVTGDDGALLVESASNSATTCDATGATVGLFDPPPVSLGLLTESDVRAPLD